MTIKGSYRSTERSPSIKTQSFILFDSRDQIAHLARIRLLVMTSNTAYCTSNGFFETPKVGIIGIFILLKYKNEHEIDNSDISFKFSKPLTSPSLY